MLLSMWSSLLLISFLNARSAFGLSCYSCGTLSENARSINDCTGPLTVEECKPDEICVVFKRLYKRGSDGIHGCYGKDKTLPGFQQRKLSRAVSSDSCEFYPKDRSSVKVCRCQTDLCNDVDYDIHTEREQKLPGNRLPSSPSTRSASSSSMKGDMLVSGIGGGAGDDFVARQIRTAISERLSEEERRRSSRQTISGTGQRIECYQCGSLFGGDSTPCNDYDRSNSSMISLCQPGEGCLLYTWMKSANERGTYRECFSTKYRLGPEENPVQLSQQCQLHRTQRDPTSTIRACLCTDNLCNDLMFPSSSIERGSLQTSEKVSASQEIDCQWSSFSNWSSCTQSCDGGTQTRERKIIMLARRGGRPCTGDARETRPCNLHGCPPRNFICPLLNVRGATFANCDGRYKLENGKVPWAPNRPVYKHLNRDRYIFWNTGGLGWSIGKREYLTTGSHWHRSGLDTDEPWQGPWENGVIVECAGTTPSETDARKGPINCIWSGYGEWSTCSVSCGRGTQQRKRMILQPASNGGQICRGSAVQSRQCTGARSCPVDCEWSSYGQWSKCSSSCGGGIQRRQRTIRVRATNGGRQCTGGNLDTRRCNEEECTVNCCDRLSVVAEGRARDDQSLYLGTYSKISDNYNGHAAYELEGPERLYVYFFTSKADNLNLWVIGPELGEFIAGIRNDGQQQCVTNTNQRWKYASRAGVWKSDDRTLLVQCFTETLTISTTQAPIQRIESSSTVRSPVDCRWGPFEDWSSCSRTCGRGVQKRQRTIIQLAEGGGRNCQGRNEEIRSCNTRPCFNQGTTTLKPVTTKKPSIRLPPPVTQEFKNIKCFICGSLFSTDAPSCEKFDAANPEQQKTCEAGEACLWYSYHKSDTEVAIIRECFSTSVLLGNIDSPIQAQKECVPNAVEDESIQACICTTNFCNGFEGGEVVSLPAEPKSRPNTQLENMKNNARQGPVTEKPERTHADMVSKFSPGARSNPNKVLCHQCGSLFSGSNNPPCEEGDTGAMDYCKEGEACLWYSWKTSDDQVSVIRECFSTSILLGSVDDPLVMSAQCEYQDISEDKNSHILACLCDTDECNADATPKRNVPQLANEDKSFNNEPGPTTIRNVQVTTTARPQKTRNTPRSTPQPGRDRIETVSGGPGLQCYSCGSLLNPSKECDVFNPSDASQIQTCKDDEACLLYKWKKSSNEIAILRECFPTRVLLGAFDNPLTAKNTCTIRDISEDSSSSIEACMCDTDFCNDDKRRTPASSVTTPSTIRISSTTTDPRGSITTIPRTLISSTPRPRISSTSRPFFDSTPDDFHLPQRRNEQTSCPENYVKLSSGCYHFSTSRTSWIVAKKKCEMDGANLIAIDSESERASILRYIQKSTNRSRVEYWLGGNDIEIENRWVWAGFDNRVTVPDFGWIDKPIVSAIENCLTWSITLPRSSSANINNGWHSESCCNLIMYICEAS